MKTKIADNLPVKRCALGAKRVSITALAFIIFLPLLVNCVTISQPGVTEIVDAVMTIAPTLIPITENEEIAIGRSIAANVAGRYGIVMDPELTRYINLVGNTVARKSDRPNLKYHFAVLDTDIINAFACPGGYIFITRGSLALIDNEAELAAVLAHEVTHVAKKHIIKEIEKSRFLEASGRVAGDLLNANHRVFDAMTSFGTNLLFNGLSKADEFQADKFGTIYSAAAGYNPTALLIFLEKLKFLGSRPDIKGVNMLFTTHPKVEKRIEKVSAVIKTRRLEKTKGETLSERYLRNVPLYGYF